MLCSVSAILQPGDSSGTYVHGEKSVVVFDFKEIPLAAQNSKL